MGPSNIMRRALCSHTYDFQRQAMSCTAAKAVRAPEPNTFAQNRPQHCAHKLHAGSPGPIAPTTTNPDMPQIHRGPNSPPNTPHRPSPRALRRREITISCVHNTLYVFLLYVFLHLPETNNSYIFNMFCGSRHHFQNKRSCELFNITGVHK